MNPIVEALKESVREVIVTYTGAEPVFKKLFLRDNEVSFGEVSAVVGLAGEKVKGAFIVSFSKEVLFRIVSALFGSAPQELNNEVEDAAGEMANMICGAFRRRFEKQGVTLKAATPSLITGKDHHIQPLCKSPHLVLLFELEGHPLVVEFCLDKN